MFKTLMIYMPIVMAILGLVYMSIKNQVKGHVNKLVMNYNFPNGEMPPVMKKVAGASESFKKKYLKYCCYSI